MIVRPRKPMAAQQTLFGDATPAVEPRVQVERTGLFHSRLLKQRAEYMVTHHGLGYLNERHTELKKWVEAQASGKLAAAETKLHGEFLQSVFGKVLGYKTRVGGGAPVWELDAEERVASNRSADGALGFFEVGRPERVVAPIELKGAAQSLDHAKGRGLTPVQQAWDYAAHVPDSRWIIVSNYAEIRLYSKHRTPHEYERFLLVELADPHEFRRFFGLLARESLLPNEPGGESEADRLLAQSAKSERDVTDSLYKDYSKLRDDLLDHLLLRHSNLPKLRLLLATQTILDRLLFIAFAEWRLLLKPGLLEAALTAAHRFADVPLWQNLCALFRWIDEGHPREDVPAYNGGLFRRVPELEELEVGDEICQQFKGLLAYNFAEDVSVEVLGHIFEQSIKHLEQKRAELAGLGQSKKKSKRKLEGVYYTPRYITRYLTEQTLGALMGQRWQEALDQHGPPADEEGDDLAWLAVWRAYRASLLQIRVLDPACGSGAFLVAAYDALAREYDRVNVGLAIHGDDTGRVDLDTAVLNHNLFGVDLNPESVEITKLALWLKTAVRGRPLRDLDRNVKHGNSVVDDAGVDPLAFDWATGNPVMVEEFEQQPETEVEREIDARWQHGFDVVIGNPPYVRQEDLKPIKAHLQQRFGCFHGAADLYVYFYERAVQVLKPGGVTGFVASDTWLRANFAAPLRGWLLQQATPTHLIGLGDNQVFADALDVNPVLSVFRRGPADDGAGVLAAAFGRGVDIEKFAELLPEVGFRLPVSGLGAEWILQPAEVLELHAKLLAAGTPLGSVGESYYGVKTGLNEAFIVDDATARRIVEEDPAAKALLGEMLRGEDLRPWYQEDNGRWLVAIPCGWTAKTFGPLLDEAAAWERFSRRHPSLAAHLLPFELAGRARGDKGEYWWELRPCAYMDEFARSKIFWPDLTQRPRWSWDESGKFLGNTGFFIAPAEPWLLAVLQSRATWFALSGIAQPRGERVGLMWYRLFTQFTERLPIPPMTDTDRQALSALARSATTLANARYDLDRQTFARIQDDLLGGDAAAGRKLAQWWALDFAVLRQEIDKRGGAMPIKERGEWQAYLGEQRAGHDRLTTELITVETEINQRVYALFGLDAAEIALIERETKYELGSV